MLKKSRAIGCLALVASVAAVLCSPAGAADAPGALGKLDTPLQRLVADADAGRDIRSEARSQGLTTRSDKVVVDVYVRGSAAGAARALEAAGMDVMAYTDRAPLPMVEGWLPVDAAEQVARLDVTQAVSTVPRPEVNAGAVTSQGDASHRGPQARALGATGAGVKVGILSNSFNRVGGGIAGSQSSGDLPPNVEVLAEGVNPNPNDEGRAMAEIVYDMAPGITNMAFATGDGGPVQKAAGITALRNSGVKVIADDIVHFGEPFFQDGVVTQAVDAAKAADVAYLTAAGNFGRKSWEGFYANGGGGLHDFDPGGGVDPTQTIATLGPGQTVRVAFQWGEPFGAATTDLNLFLVNMGTNAIVDFSIDNNLVSGIPEEFILFTNNTGADMTVGLRITRFAGAGSPFMKWLGNATVDNIEHFNPNVDALNPEAASALGALTVAAVAHDQPGLNVVEDSSSRGPKLRLFPVPQLRQKPDIAAADGVATTVPGFNPFYGTSAAAPSAAGVAALIRSANPGLTVDQVYAILRSTANNIDCTLPPPFPQPDVDCGFGFVLADRAVANALAARGGGAGPGPVPGAVPGPGPGPGAVPVPALTPCQKAQQALAAAKTAAKKAKGKKKKKAKRAVTKAKRAVKKACSKKKKKKRKKRRRNRR